jgi:hypothetical protein
MKLIPAPISDANSKDSPVFLTKILVRKPAKMWGSKVFVLNQNHIHLHTQRCNLFIILHVTQNSDQNTKTTPTTKVNEHGSN